MALSHVSKSASIRAQVNHPIIDSDGHQVEIGPIFFDYLRAEAGPKVADRFPAKLYALYGSDVGHWDVPDMGDAAHEAYELVEQGLLSETDFRAMVFTNAVKFWTSTNPNFFQGTVVEDKVRQLLSSSPTTR